MRRGSSIVLMVILVAACAGDDGGDTETAVRPFAEIQASDFVFEVDPLDPGRAIFRVTTTEPSICSITWGATEAMGNQNNSLSMNGTGIVQHDVILPGALPGETYAFSVQGSTADGQLYQSEIATFTLPEAAAGPPDVDRGPNVALGARVVDVSSEFNASFGADLAFDGDLGTEWSTRGDGDDGFVTIDLGESLVIGGVEFITRSMADGSAITDRFSLTVDDGAALGPFGAGSPADPRFQELVATGRVLRFAIESSTGGNTGAVEIRVFGPQS